MRTEWLIVNAPFYWRNSPAYEMILSLCILPETLYLFKGDVDIQGAAMTGWRDSARRSIVNFCWLRQ